MASLGPPTVMEAIVSGYGMWPWLQDSGNMRERERGRRTAWCEWVGFAGWKREGWEVAWSGVERSGVEWSGVEWSGVVWLCGVGGGGGGVVQTVCTCKTITRVHLIRVAERLGVRLPASPQPLSPP